MPEDQEKPAISSVRFRTRLYGSGRGTELLQWKTCRLSGKSDARTRPNVPLFATRQPILRSENYLPGWSVLAAEVERAVAESGKLHSPADI